ncbi:MAG: CubicO group peptidase (beta-lactamase class C family) [Candidatus Marinamargulisbacteria bacterium]|jgi:CubicO group peptidase (beta-lactamase class C family)
MYLRLSKIGIAVFLLGTLLSCDASGPKGPVKKGDYKLVAAHISETMNTYVHGQGIRGVSIALVDEGNEVWAAGFGHIDLEGRVTANADSVYQIGSITKLLTMTVALKLWEQKKLDFHSHITSYLPDFSIRSVYQEHPVITPHMLLTHHSGLPRDLYSGLWQSTDKPLNVILEDLSKQHVVYPPYYAFSYSNLGYAVLGAMMAEISGKSFSDLVEREVFNPLGMSRSGFRFGPEPYFSKGYSRDGVMAFPRLFRDTSAIGAYSSVSDLSRWMRMFLNDGKVGATAYLSPKSVENTFNPQNRHIGLDFDLSVGLGWFLSDTALDYDTPVAFHEGNTTEFVSYLAVVPEYKIGVVILANTVGSDAALKKMAHQALSMMIETKTGNKPDRVVTLSEYRPFSGDSRLLEAKTGYYATPIGIVKVKRVGNQLETILGGKKFEFFPTSDSNFRIRYQLFPFISVSDSKLDMLEVETLKKGGKNLVVLKYADRRYLIGEKLTPRQFPVAWKTLNGRYSLVSDGNDEAIVESVEFRHKDGFIFADVYSKWLETQFEIPSVSVAIKPISETEALVNGMGSHINGTVTLLDDTGSQFSFSGLIFKRDPSE